MSCVLSEKVKPAKRRSLELVRVRVQGMVSASPAEEKGLRGGQEVSAATSV